MDVSFSNRLNIARLGGDKSAAVRSLTVEGLLIDGHALGASHLLSSGIDVGFVGESISLYDIFSPALLSLASQLNREGLITDYVRLASESSIAEKQTEEPIVVAITTTLYTSARPVRKIVRWIRKYMPASHIVVGGPWIMTAHNEFDSSTFNYLGADSYIVSGEGGAELISLVKGFRAGKLEACKGIVLKRDGDWQRTQPLNSNTLSMPVGHDVDWKSYAHEIGTFAFVGTAKSCVFKCGFCDFIEREGKYKPFDVEGTLRVLDSIEAIGTVKSVVFVDDTLNVPAKRFIALLNAMIARKYNFKWSGFFRCDWANNEAFEMLQKSGCEFLKLGLESGSQTVLNAMGKRASVEKYEFALQKLNAMKMPYWCSFLTGYPGETLQTIEETKQFITNNDLFLYRVSPWYCSTLTRVFREREKHGLKGTGYNWSHTTMDIDGAINAAEYLSQGCGVSMHLPLLVVEDAISLLHRGISWEQVRQFIAAFNSAVSPSISSGAFIECNEKSKLELNAARAGLRVNFE